jgi:DNA-binding CsgD family transcriptional regulator
MIESLSKANGSSKVSKRRLPSTRSSAQLSEVIGHIYDAATSPLLWPAALREVLRFVGNSGTHLCLMDGDTGLVSHSVHVGMPDQLIDEYNSEIIKDCPRVAHYRAKPNQLLLCDYQHIDERGIDSNDYYHWLQTTGDTIRYYLGGRIRTTAGAEGFQSLAFRKSEGHAQREHIERFSALLPHIQRAVDIGQQLGTWRFLADLSSEVIDRLTHGVILLDKKQQVLKVNKCAEQLLQPPSPLYIRQGMLAAWECETQRKLQRLIGQCVATSTAAGTSAGGLITARRGQDDSAIHVLICPMKATAGSLEVRPPVAAIFLHDPNVVVKIDEQAIRSGFGLTPAESRLTVLLIAGRSLPEASAQLGVSRHTVRSQLKDVFAKTGVNSQADLLRMLLPLCHPIR